VKWEQSLLAIGCEAAAKAVNAPPQESRADFIAGKPPTGGHKQVCLLCQDKVRRKGATLLRGIAAAGYAFGLGARQQSIYLLWSISRL
jgi:hypothetical protein